MSGPIRLTALGDISFEGRMADAAGIDVFSDIVQCFQGSDLVLANLECALTERGHPIPGKCTLRGTQRWAQVLRSAGIDLVSLANNHTMDYGAVGLADTMAALDAAGIKHVGAGSDRDAACAPVFLELLGRRLAVLARSAVVVSAHTYASETAPGVARFEPEETLKAIRRCRQQVDDVVLLLHWGLEEYAYPSPDQRRTAAALIEAGANVIIGHHPHVLQGFERIGRGVVFYSLGNFLFDEFDWTYRSEAGAELPQRARLTGDNRRGVVLTLEWSADGALLPHAHPTRVDAEGGVRPDTRPPEMGRLSRRLCRGWYPLWWRAYAAHREWQLRVSSALSVGRLLRNLHRVRPRHVRDVVSALRRSGRMVAQSSTNPYE